MSLLTEEQKAGVANAPRPKEIMTTTKPKPSIDANPFRRQKHRRLGGQYVAPSLTDRCERSLAKHQEAVDFERAKAEALSDTRWHPAF